MTAESNSFQAWMVTVLDEHETNLIRYAQRILGDPERARDIVQDTFLKLCRESNPRSHEGHLAAWLFRVCRNAALDVKRREKRMNVVVPGQLESSPGSQSLPETALEHEETMQQVTSSIERLPPRQQEAIRLKFEHGLSYRQISDVTGMSVSNVGFQIHCGMKTLRQKLRPATA